MDTKKVLVSSPINALLSEGFVRAFLYSFGSFITGWIILVLADPAISNSFGKYAVVVPMLNMVAVFFKQYFDELKK